MKSDKTIAIEVERSAVDPAVQQSVEFSTACPVSAQAMLLELRNHA